MKDFWLALNKPILALAPMEDVTDTVFRQIVSTCAPPHVFFTEFTNIDGLFSKGSKKVSSRLQFSKKERPIIAQIWGNKPELYYKAAKYIEEKGFDGIDINMGCPEKKIVKNGSCAALIKNPSLAVDIIKATKKGVINIPVSVKTRIGYSKIETDSWITLLLNQDIDALIIHARTVKEMSDVPAHWNEIKKSVEIRNMLEKKTVIIGNGDVFTYKQAIEYIKRYSVDGIMIGRGIFKDPWVFNNTNRSSHDTKTMLKLLLTHMKMFNRTWGNTKNFAIMKKFYKMYITKFSSAKELREQLYQFSSAEESILYLEKYIRSL